MMMNQLVKRSIILKQRIPATVALLGMRYPMRAFALPKYSFEGEAF